MFDHVKHVQEWTTMAYHIYDLVYYKVLAITINDMQSKSVEVQCVMWKKIDQMMLKFGFANPNFKGFMANNAHPIGMLFGLRIVYSSRNPFVNLLVLLDIVT